MHIDFKEPYITKSVLYQNTNIKTKFNLKKKIPQPRKYTLKNYILQSPLQFQNPKMINFMSTLIDNKNMRAFI